MSNLIVPNEPQKAENEKAKLPKLAYSVQEVAEILGISYISVFRLIQRRLLKSCKVLRHHIIPAAEVERFLKENTKQAA